MEASKELLKTVKRRCEEIKEGIKGIANKLPNDLAERLMNAKGALEECKELTRQIEELKSMIGTRKQICRRVTRHSNEASNDIAREEDKTATSTCKQRTIEQIIGTPSNRNPPIDTLHRSRTNKIGVPKRRVQDTPNPKSSPG